jgi:hypothetical protein
VIVVAARQRWCVVGLPPESLQGGDIIWGDELGAWGRETEKRVREETERG